MKQKIAIIALGKQNSGKSTTWYELFGRTIRTGWKTLRIGNKHKTVFIKNSSFEETGQEICLDVFVRNASFEEYGDEIEDYFDLNTLPEIVLCSVQYTEKGIRTITWFKENGYSLYIQWINKGFCHETEYDDFLNFEERFSPFGVFNKVSGKEADNRVAQIKQFLVNWINEH